jgi:hypothetical protein
MDDYKKMLNSLDVKGLKGFVKQYMGHLKITVSKKTKAELIEHIMKHTELKNNKVVLKDVEFDTPKKSERKPKEEPKEELKPKKEAKKPEPKKEELLDKVLRFDKQKEKQNEKKIEKII